MKETIIFFGLDSHEDRISETPAETTGAREVRQLGEIDNTAEAVGALVEKRGQTHDALAFCYRAGPCGDGIHRQITALGQDYMVVAPSLIPRRPGGRIKTNRRRRAPIHPKRRNRGRRALMPKHLENRHRSPRMTSLGFVTK